MRSEERRSRELEVGNGEVPGGFESGKFPFLGRDLKGEKMMKKRVQFHEGLSVCLFHFLSKEAKFMTLENFRQLLCRNILIWTNAMQIDLDTSASRYDWFREELLDPIPS